MMKVKFANGTKKDCSAPAEQKLFKTNAGALVPAGWVLTFRMNGETTSSELDELLTKENVSTLEFIEESESITESYTISGYDTVTSLVIRHSSNPDMTSAEIQLSKGV